MALKDLLHQEMESAQDVAGWKSIIFLPFQVIWQVLLIISIFFAFIFTTNMVTYDISTRNMLYTIYLCDILYLADVGCAILHRYLKDIRKLKNFQPRSWLLLLIDCLSLIPFELIYLNLYHTENGNSTKVWALMFLNRCLRIYRFYYYCMQAEMSAQSLEYAYIFSYLEMLMVGSCCTHIASCIYQSLKSDEENQQCPPDRYGCILLNEMNIYFILVQRFIGNSTTYNTLNKRLACCVFITVGHFFAYGWIIPKFIFSCMKRLTTFFEFRNRYKRLQMFVSNVIENESLEKKTLDEFRTVWTYGKGDVEPEMLKAFPINLRKNAYSDVYWDALRHSELLQDLSYGCKRSLALKFVGDFYMPGTIFWDIGEHKDSMLYLSSGILQIMAEENSNSPIMSFSGGTILGETTMFYPCRSKAILRVATFSEIHVLHLKDIFRVIKDFPEDREIMRRNLRLRIMIAKMTQIRKREISKVIFDRNVAEFGDFLVDEDDSVKWIKTQFREIALLQELYAKDDQNYLDSKVLEILKKRLGELRTGIDHTSIYLPLLNLGEDIEILTDVTCLKTSLPWVIDPTSHFIRLWRMLVLLWVAISCTVFPVFLAWWSVLPAWISGISQFITVLFLVDIFVQVSTAVKTKATVIVHSGAIFRYRLRSVSFYADVISALPIQFFLEYYRTLNEEEELFYRLSIALALLRGYKLIIFLNEWCETVKGRFSLRVMIKYLFLYSLWIYWCSAILHFSDVRCKFSVCKEGTWYKKEYESIYPNYKELASPFFCMNFLMDVPDTFDYNENYPSIIYIIICISVLYFMLMLWFGDYNAAYMLEMSQEIKFKTLLQSVANFMNERNIIGRIKKRVMDTMFFQWHYDAGDYMTQKRAMLEDASEKLNQEVNKSTIFKVMRTCEVLRYESDSFIWHLCKKCKRLALPANSIVVTYGTQTMTLYIVYKGYLQMNSFLPRDTIDGWASPILYGPGKILPLVVALNQMPSGVTARTLTDCELIAINLEDFLTALVLNNCFKDFVSVIRKVNLEPFRKARLTISKINNPFEMQKQSDELFARFKVFGWFLRLLLTMLSVKGESGVYLHWELFRLFIVVVSATLWPVVFELPISENRTYLVCFLLALESFGWFDFYIKFHVGFYNKSGIYVTHPLATAKHYLATSFIVELTAFFPYFHSLILLSENYSFPVSDTTAILHSTIRLLGLYRLYLFITNKESIGNFVIYLKGFGYLLILLISVNCFILLKIRSELVYSTRPDGSLFVTLSPKGWIKTVNVPTAETLGSHYLIMLYCVIMLFFRSYPFFKDYTREILVCDILFALMGMVLVFFGHAFCLSRIMGAKMNFTLYQYHMKSLTHFLKVEKAEDSISNAVVAHFEHEWERKKGEDLHNVFSRFPNILEEDLMYPIYKKTLNQIPCFQHANEAFFRNLSRLIIEVHFKKGSNIMFKNGVHKDIYFIHKGQCFVRDENVILTKGSMMGDIQGKGKMKSNIMAKTHVMLLLINSHEFFIILNNFYQTEMAFFNKVKGVEDFLQSDYVDEVEDDVEDVAAWASTVKKKEECEFELAEEMEESSESVRSKKTKEKRSFLRKIHPNSVVAKIFRVIFVMDAILTTFVVPVIISLRLDMTSALVTLYILDLVWVLKIVITIQTAYIESDTGNLVTNTKDIFKNYVRTSDGFIVDVLSVFPFEYVHKLIRYLYSGWSNACLKYCYLFRLLRLLCLWINVSREKRKLSLSEKKRWFIIILRHVIPYNFLTAINLLLATDPAMKVEDYQTEYTYHLKDAFIWSYLSMFNVYAGTGFYIFPPSNLLQISFQIIVSILSVMERTLLTSEVLSLINVSLYVKSKNLIKVQVMDKYLAVRDVSPALKNKLSVYAKDLLGHFNAEVMPWFLKTSPYYIKVQIMQDLYMQYLLKCNVFQGLEEDFLIQLAARLTCYIYSPSDVIAEMGDVDNTMYFIHGGEVASVEKNPFYLGLDYESDFFTVGDNFGVEQGLGRSIPHKTTYRAITRVDLLSLNFYDWEDLRVAFPEVTQKIYKRMNERQKIETAEPHSEHNESK